MLGDRPAVRRAAKVIRDWGRLDTQDRQAATAEEAEQLSWNHFPGPSAEDAARRTITCPEAAS